MALGRGKPNGRRHPQVVVRAARVRGPEPPPLPSGVRADRRRHTPTSLGLGECTPRDTLHQLEGTSPTPPPASGVRARPAIPPPPAERDAPLSDKFRAAAAAAPIPLEIEAAATQPAQPVRTAPEPSAPEQRAPEQPVPPSRPPSIVVYEWDAEGADRLRAEAARILATGMFRRRSG